MPPSDETKDEAKDEALQPRRLLLPRSPTALAGAAAAAVNSALRVAVVPLFVTPLIDDVVGRGELGNLPLLLALAALLVVGSSAALWAQDALLATSAARMAERWRERLFRRLLGRRPGTLGGTSGGLASRILHDLREIETYYQFGLGTLIAESFAIGAILAVLAASNLAATALLALLFLPTVAALRFVGARLEHLAQRSQEGTEELGAHLQEGLRHHETVRAFGAVRFILDRFRPANRRTASSMTRRGLIAALQVPVTQVLALAAVGALVAVLARSAAAGEMTTGEIVSFVTLVALLSTPAQLLPKGVAMAQQARAAARRLAALAAHPSTSYPEDGSLEVTTGEPPSLELTGVDLGYENVVIQDAGLDLLGPGLAVIVGESGSGKTTLLRALLRFLEPLRGSVVLCGIPLADWPEADLRRTVAYVPQGHELLRGSVRENLALGRDVDGERLWQVLREVGMDGVVGALPHGLEERLAEDGGGLSGGQRQRLAIARALLSEPALLLLDEPTSNLDARSEREIVAVLRDQARQRLVVAVTHRPALAQAGDEVWEIGNGRLNRTESRRSRPMRSGSR